MVRPATAEDNLTLTVRRKFPVSQQTLFNAWTDKQQIAQWFGPTPEHAVEVREYDFQVGGSYQLAFSKGGEPARDIVTGKFELIDEPNKVAYTWKWLPPSDHAEVDSRVTVEFVDLGDETELVLTHEHLGNDEMRDSHEQGWCGCLDCLAVHVKK